MKMKSSLFLLLLRVLFLLCFVKRMVANKVLNVAEKPSAAEEISQLLAGTRPRKRPGLSKYNPIWEFKYNILGGNADMVFTSVLGHLMNTEVEERYIPWYSCEPVELFHCGVRKYIQSDDNQNLFKTIQREARQCDTLVLWLDCDREGENIAFEVIDCAVKANRNLMIYRARFSSIIPQEVKRACANLVRPNENDSIAVDTRIEIDLRLGAAFTRFQTLYLRGKFDLTPGNDEDKQPISYGPCQFPTLGFVVERYLRIENFIPEDFWSMNVKHSKEELTVNFGWKRKRLFDHAPAFILYEKCLDNPLATVIDIQKKNHNKLQKSASSKLRISSDRTMKIAEELYNKGFISYPRTETSQFIDGTDFQGLIGLQTGDPQWGQYATRLLNGEFKRPNDGRTNDHSHPPIHPTNFLPPGAAGAKDPKARELYEFIVRHFLACCSPESIIAKTTVSIDVAGEKFSESGSMIIRRGYLEVYKYEKRNDKIIPTYEVGEQFTPTDIKLESGRTVSPRPLSEPELLSAMDSNQIGTDATMAQHIQKIIERGYVIKDADQLFVPTNLGKALIVGYDSMGFEFSKPALRASIEADIQKIGLGQRTKEQVLRDTIEKYKTLFIQAQNQTQMLDVAFSKHFASKGQTYQTLKANFSKCGKCNNLMDLKKTNGDRKILNCSTCNTSYNLPQKGEFIVNAHTCPLCKFQVVSVQTDKTTYTICPFCRNHPPASSKEGPGKPFHCFQCTEKCQLATGHNFKPNQNNNQNNQNNNNYQRNQNNNNNQNNNHNNRPQQPSSSTFKKKPAAPSSTFKNRYNDCNNNNIDLT
ncbi:DNA topoisomerase III [Cavenderia fasciculata]|uniref:DNA topoisomerase n=1 Tax=Cavenderia fasciculata TaxID=261658 RepID=F4PXY0_CACFS|nr:DNA topoisomerase III [Cavenderia fasciculata]EGG19640.1 DNA topoisomerase III [Cavenderia fasciculata]|eukprot:XP_004357934.1 DNA topoisomerase III [Cavenderia fasciculata]